MFTSAVSCRSRKTTATKCTKQCDPRTKLLFCQSNPLAFLPSSLPSLSSLLKLLTNVPLKTMKQRPCWWTQKSSGTWIRLFSSQVKNFFSLKKVADHVSESDLYCVIRLTWQQDGNVIWRRQSARKGLNSTSGAQFAAQPLVKPVVWFARAVVNWRSRSVAKSA